MIAALLIWTAAALPPISPPPHVSRSQKLTAAAEKLLEFEKKLEAEAGEPIDDLLYTDVLNLLDIAVEADPNNLHARALRGPILVHLAFDGESYDVCYLVDAQEDADQILKNQAKSNAADVLSARRVIRSIQRIPASKIPDSPSVCDDGEGDEEGQRRGSRT